MTATAKKRAPRVRTWKGNPASSEWFSTSDEARGRKRFTVTLAPETITLLQDEKARSLKPYSQIVEEAILAYVKPVRGRSKKSA